MKQFYLSNLLKNIFKTLFVLILFIGFKSYSQVGTSFENDLGITFTSTPDCRYFDSDFTTTHVLQNYITSGGCGEITVNKSPTVNELGYTITWAPTGANAGSGLSDGDAFGVATSTSLISELGVGAPDGNQGFIMEDSDGEIVMTFSDVNLAVATNPQFSMQYALGATSWETSDYIYIHIDPKNCTNISSVTLLDTRGIDIDGNFNEGSWQTLNADLSAYVGCDVNLVVEYSSNAAAEEFGIDNISFSEGQTLNIEQTEEISEIKIYQKQNTRSTIVINTNSLNTEEIIIHDLLGKVVKSFSIIEPYNEFELNVSSLSKGIYILQLKNSRGNLTKKFYLK